MILSFPPGSVCELFRTVAYPDLSYRDPIYLTLTAAARILTDPETKSPLGFMS